MHSTILATGSGAATSGHGIRASVVVPTYRRPQRCRRLLDALAAQKVPAAEFEVIVVDDCSGDATAEMLCSAAADLPYLLRPMQTESNAGPARARNVGWKAARADVVGFIDDDCVPDPAWLASGIQAFCGRETVGVVQGRTSPPQDHDGAGLPRWHHKQDITAPTPYFESCNIFYRRDALLAAGGFDEQIGWWGEDTSLAWSVLDLGWESDFAAEAVAFHDVECRGWRWHVSAGMWEANTVRLAKMHPGFRGHFWRPWAFRRREPALALAALGVLAAAWWRPALLAAAPYAWVSRESPSDPRFAVHWLENLAVDASRLAGHLVGSWQNRTLVL